jgi:hypothetical protein
MAADTGMKREQLMGPNQKLKAINRLDDHASNARKLIIKGRRSPDEVGLLFLAHQAFRANRLGGIVWTVKDRPTAEELNAACNLEIEQLGLESKDKKYLRQRGIKYVGEVFCIFFDPKSRPSVETGQRILGVIERQLGISPDTDPLAEGWVPCYWGEQFSRMLNTPLLELFPTPPVHDWDEYTYKTRYWHRGGRSQKRILVQQPVDARGTGREWANEGVHFVGQLRRLVCDNEHCPQGKFSAGNLNRLRMQLREIGNGLRAGAVHPPDHTYPDLDVLEIWRAELARIKLEKLEYADALVRAQTRLDLENAEQERLAEERAKQREEEARQKLIDAERAKDQTSQEERRPSLAVLLKRVDEIEMSVRLANCLQNQGIETYGQVITYTEARLLRTKYFGRKTLRELKELLAEDGLRLGFSDGQHMQLSDFAECAPEAN